MHFVRTEGVLPQALRALDVALQLVAHDEVDGVLVVVVEHLVPQRPAVGGLQRRSRRRRRWRRRRTDGAEMAE